MNLDTKNLPPEVAAYIRSLEQKNQQLEKQLVKMQSLNEQLVKMRKRMFGQSSEQMPDSWTSSMKRRSAATRLRRNRGKRHR